MADMKQPTRCPWAKSEMMVRYHDAEWGVPLRDDRKLFEFLCLEGAQAGLSWETILRKRPNYRRAFDNFQPALIAKYNAKKMARLLKDEGIVRNRLKIKSVVQNARAFLALRSQFGSFDKYLLQFVPQTPGPAPRALGEVPARTVESDRLSKDLKKRGFSFVGSTICYAFMQAVGMVNDHSVNCFRRSEILAISNNQ
jgi:DNA-3-methyladenine glycosylase I